MTRRSAVTALLLLSALTAAQAGVTSISFADLQTQCIILSLKDSPVEYGAGRYTTKDLKRPEGEPAGDPDLRQVDRQEVRAETNKNGNGVNGSNGDDDGDDAENGKDDKGVEGGGWDRIWDAPKLG